MLRKPVAFRYNNLGGIRFKSTLAEVEKNLITIKPYSEIPGPKRMPLLGNIVEFEKKGGLKRIGNVLTDWHKTYGDFIRIKFGPKEMVSIADADLTEMVFREGGKYPVRTAMPYTAQYTKERGEKPIIADAVGEEWIAQRRPLSKAFLHPSNMEHYIVPLNRVGQDFINLIEKNVKNTPDRVYPNLENLSQRYAFEAVSTVLFGEGLGSLKDPIEPHAEELLNRSVELLTIVADNIREFPLHEFIPFNWIPKYRRFRSSFEVATKMGEHFLKEKSHIPTSLMANVLKSDTEEQYKYKVPLVALLAGADTTQVTIQWFFYFLAIYKDVQQKVYDEINSFVPLGTQLTYENLSKMTYLKNVISEIFRISPPSFINNRILDHDVEIRGYHVPAGTNIFLVNGLTTKDPKVWGDPENFRPERWNEKVHPFASLPFGHGSRNCLGQRIALTELQVVMIFTLQNYRLEFKGEKAPTRVTRVGDQPEEPPKIAFIPRNQS